MDKCLICGNDGFSIRPYGNGFPSLSKEAKIQVCTRCEFGQVTPLPDPVKLDAYYRADQYQKWHSSEKLHQLEVLPHSRALNQYDSLGGYLNFNNVRNVLDFGAGSAPTTRTIKIRHPHINTTAIELSGSIRKLLADCNEIDKVYDIIPADLPLQNLIIVSGTLEHLVNPLVMLKKFKQLLHEWGGYLSIEVPNCPYPFYYDVKKNHTPHLCFFSKNTFSVIASKLEFDLIYVTGMGVGIKEWSETKNRLDIVIRTGLCYAPNKNGVYLRALLRKKGD